MGRHRERVQPSADPPRVVQDREQPFLRCVGPPLTSAAVCARVPQVSEPYGVALIISPWNYPISLCLIPLATAFAAGNAVVLKPSEVATPPNRPPASPPCNIPSVCVRVCAQVSVSSTQALVELLPKYVDNDALAIVEGAADATTHLLRQKVGPAVLLSGVNDDGVTLVCVPPLQFDVIMYTGSGTVGKIVMHAAAEHLTPVILELGGKSPAIVHPDANLSNAAKRIVWGKFTLNCGQVPSRARGGPCGWTLTRVCVCVCADVCVPGLHHHHAREQGQGGGGVGQNHVGVLRAGPQEVPGCVPRHQ